MRSDRDRLLKQSEGLGNPLFCYRKEGRRRSQVEIVGAEVRRTPLGALDMGLPIVVLLSFCGMSRCFFRVPAEAGGGVYDRDPLRLDTVALPEIIFDAEPVDVPAAMRTTFNTVWNGFGYAKSEMHSDRGEWRGVG
jgi:hypothetical protein